MRGTGGAPGASQGFLVVGVVSCGVVGGVVGVVALVVGGAVDATVVADAVVGTMPTVELSGTPVVDEYEPVVVE